MVSIIQLHSFNSRYIIGDIKPKEVHHTSASHGIPAFYDGSVIRYAASCCNESDNPGVEIVEVFDGRSENWKNENLEKLAVELVKHKITVYMKYLRK